MKANHLHRIFKSILCACVTTVCASSCVYIDDHLGENFIPTNQQYDVYTMAFPLKNISMAYADSLSGFSSTRFTVGSIRDPETGGLTSRSSAFTLVPLNEEMDFGEDPQVIQFHFTAVKDTVSCIAEDEERILQNIRVYEVKKDLGSKYIYTSSGYRMEDDGIIGNEEISAPIIYNGGDSLSFDFTKKFSKAFIETLADKFADIEDIDGYNEAFPGIYITADEPVGNGGRINMFGLALGVNDSYYVTSNYAELKFSALFEGESERRDTSYLFYFGAQDLTYSSSTAQYALNVCRQDGYDKTTPGNNILQATEKIIVQGGGGLKPVISAQEIRDSLHTYFEKNGTDYMNVVINKASLIMPFDDPKYETKGIYPAMLSPTCRLRSEVTSDEDEEETENSVYYAGLTDASVSSENQGNVNWSLSQYAPDITHHVQEIIKLGDDADFSTRDIWLLIMATETITETSDNSSMNEYMQNLLYNSYYNNLYGYGYGNYGYGYGGYYDYNNYYNYYMMAAMMSNASQPTTSSSTQLDKDRFYVCTLRGPEATTLPDGVTQSDIDNALSRADALMLQGVPMMKVTYSVPKRGE